VVRTNKNSTLLKWGHDRRCLPDTRRFLLSGGHAALRPEGFALKQGKKRLRQETALKFSLLTEKKTNNIKEGGAQKQMRGSRSEKNQI